MKKYLIGLFIILFAVFVTCDNKETEQKPGDEPGEEPKKGEVSIAYRANGGTGVMLIHVVEEESTITLKENLFTKTGYSFIGWALTETGAVKYSDKEEITLGSSNLVLFAIWTASTYTISFDANGGKGGQTTTVTVTFDSPMPALSSAVPTTDDSDYIFNGYFDAKNNGVRYYSANLSSVRNWDKAENITLYAGWRPIIIPDNSSIVSLVQSKTVTNVTQHTYATIKALVDEAIALAGGLEGIVKTGDTVVLKPNIITTAYGWAWPSSDFNKIPAGASNAAAQAAPNGIVTDWRVVQAVAENVRTFIGAKGAAGAGKILVMESSGKGGPVSGTADQYANVGYNLTNLSAVDEILTLDAVGGKYWDWEEPSPFPDDIKKIKLENPVFKNEHYPFYDGQGNYYVVKRMYEADALICIPVLKLHTTAGTTGTIKNISIGATPPRIYGNSAGDIGRNFRIPHSENDGLHKWLADYYSVMPADFTVMEALQGVDQGPLPPAGDPNALKRMNSMLASKDGLAIDTVLSNIIKVDYARVGHLVYLTQRGEVGTKPNHRLKVRGNPNDITVLGNKKVHDLRDGVNFSGSISTGLGEGSISTTRLSEEQLAKPTVAVTSAEFIGNNLILNLNVSANAVKADIYIDNVYIRSVNDGLDYIVINTSAIAGGSHNITVFVYSSYMAYGEASAAAVK